MSKQKPTFDMTVGFFYFRQKSCSYTWGMPASAMSLMNGPVLPSASCHRVLYVHRDPATRYALLISFALSVHNLCYTICIVPSSYDRGALRYRYE